MTHRLVRIAFILTAACLAATAPLVAQSNATQPASAGHDGGFWKTATFSEDRELNTQALQAHEALCQCTGADACLVVHRGRIVQEWYSTRYTVPMYAMSSTKSVAGLLTGMLIDDGRIRSMSQPVCDFIGSWCTGLRASVSVAHLLSMTSGLPMMPDSSVGFVTEKNAFVEHLSPTSQPGTSWAYSNEGAQLLSPLLDQAAGEPIQDYARRRLFEPLGMSSTRLHVYPKNAWTYADMETTARDFARLGVLMLNRGSWSGKQIVSAAWVDESTQPSQRLNPRYGLLWWIDPEIKGYAAHGHLDTDLHVIPDLQLVIVRMQSKALADVPEGTYERAGLALFRDLVKPKS